MIMRLSCESLAAVVALSILALAGCDGAESQRLCELLGVANYERSAPFLDKSQLAVAQFELQQKITTYENGDCDLPSTSGDGVRLIVINLTTCALGIDFSLSVFEGREGWTVERTVSVARGAANDIGIIITEPEPHVDAAQIILTATVVRSGCV